MPRLPVVTITHGAGALPLMKQQPEVVDFLGQLLSTLPFHPKAILMIDVQWRTATPHVNSSPAPSLNYTYKGFPPSVYDLPTPTVGSPQVAARVAELLADAEIPCTQDPDHQWTEGVFVPLLCMGEPGTLPPVVDFSVPESEAAEDSISIGAALAPLRDEGVLIVCSGSTFNNVAWAKTNFNFTTCINPKSKEKLEGDKTLLKFDAWLRETLAGKMSEDQRMERLRAWEKAPGARFSHPVGKADHILPTFVAYGAAGGPGKAIGDERDADKIIYPTFKNSQFEFNTAPPIDFAAVFNKVLIFFIGVLLPLWTLSKVPLLLAFDPASDDPYAVRGLATSINLEHWVEGFRGQRLPSPAFNFLLVHIGFGLTCLFMMALSLRNVSWRRKYGNIYFASTLLMQRRFIQCKNDWNLSAQVTSFFHKSCDAQFFRYASAWRD